MRDSGDSDTCVQSVESAIRNHYMIMCAVPSGDVILNTHLLMGLQCQHPSALQTWPLSICVVGVCGNSQRAKSADSGSYFAPARWSS